MIQFSCPHCGRSFTVPEEKAGRQGRCKGCNQTITVPAPQRVPPQPKPPPSRVPVGGPNVPPRPSPPPAPPIPTPLSAPTSYSGGRKPPPRIRRLRADAEHMRSVFRDFPIIKIMTTRGNPPDLYQIEYHVLGLTRGPSGQPVRQNVHRVEIRLTREYPRESPQCRMLSPVFHPNIEPSMICVGDHWTAGERLVDLVIRIGEMITYQAYNIKSPLDGEAAMWADMNAQHLPVDTRDLHPPNWE